MNTLMSLQLNSHSKPLATNTTCVRLLTWKHVSDMCETSHLKTCVRHVWDFSPKNMCETCVRLLIWKQVWHLSPERMCQDMSTTNHFYSYWSDWLVENLKMYEYCWSQMFTYYDILDGLPGFLSGFSATIMNEWITMLILTCMLRDVIFHGFLTQEAFVTSTVRTWEFLIVHLDMTSELLLRQKFLVANWTRKWSIQALKVKYNIYNYITHYRKMTVGFNFF